MPSLFHIRRIIVDTAVGGSLTINGNGAVIERSSSTQFFRLHYVSTNADLTLDRITLRGGYLISSSGRGGAIYNAGAMRLSDSTIIQNASSTTSEGVNDTQGGGIYNEGTLTIDTTSIFDNTVASFDGAISNQSAGGGIYNANIGMFRRLPGGSDAVMYQDWNYEMPSGISLMVRLQLENLIAILPRRVDVVLRSLDGAESFTSNFVAAPNSPMLPFTMSIKTTTPWHGMRLEFHPYDGSATHMMQLDSVIVERTAEFSPDTLPLKPRLDK